MDTRIYVMTHKEIAELPDKNYIPLHVGRVTKEDLGYLGDDTGENISLKNDNYCELTGMYWIWKNVQCDIVGICHYRHYFIREKKLLEKSYIEQIIQRYPIIVPNSCCASDAGTYRRDEEAQCGQRDLKLCREVLEKKYPEYVPAFDYSMRAILVSGGNMLIARKDIYNSYCSWLFDILFEVEKRMDTAGYDVYQKRGLGFLAERLFRVWLLMQSDAIREEEIKRIEPADFQSTQKQLDLLQQCVKLKILPVLQLHMQGTMKESLAAPLLCEDDFEGKIPVWVCWWQGESEMPELVQCCYKSLKRNLPWQKVTLRLITLENCMKYVTFTEAVIRKFNEGKISPTQLSDILRAELLYRYGGMWIDATYYVASPIPEGIFDGKSIFTIRYETPIWIGDVTKGRWSGNLVYTYGKHKLFQFLMESFWYYWEKEDTLIDYFLIDYIIAVAVEAFPEIEKELEQCPYSSKKVLELQEEINRKYTPERIQEIRKEALFYKLDRRKEYYKENMIGEKTIYGFLVEEENRLFLS